MATLPTPIRAVLGLAATAIDEARRLPETLPQLPVAAISTAMQTSLRVQQHIAEYAARGDELLTALRGSSDEPPAWATFDDDGSSASDGATKAAFDLIDGADAVAEEEPSDLIASPGTASDDADADGGSQLGGSAAAVAAPAKKTAAKTAPAKAAKKTPAEAATQAPAKAAKKAPKQAPAKAAKQAPAKAAKQAPAKAAKKAAKQAPAKRARRSEPLEVAAQRADPTAPPNPSVLAAEIVQAHQAESE